MKRVELNGPWTCTLQGKKGAVVCNKNVMPKLNKTDWGISNNNEPIIIELPPYAKATEDNSNADRFIEPKAV